MFIVKLIRALLVIFVFLATFFPVYINISTFAAIEPDEENLLFYDLATDPDQLSEAKFYKYESAIIRGFSGSGGYFLPDEEIQWILRCEKAFKDKGINLKDREYRHTVIAWSYFSDEKYNKAYEEFESMNDQGGMELSEWFINNKGIENGIVNIKEHGGEISFGASETARVEDDKYLFIAYFKGPVYRYDKDKKQHALIYAPDNHYNWPVELKINDENLIVTLRDDADALLFNNTTNEISQLSDYVEVRKRGG